MVIQNLTTFECNLLIIIWTIECLYSESLNLFNVCLLHVNLDDKTPVIIFFFFLIELLKVYD